MVSKGQQQLASVLPSYSKAHVILLNSFLPSRTLLMFLSLGKLILQQLRQKHQQFSVNVATLGAAILSFRFQCSSWHCVS